LTVSVGVAPNRYVAKIASGLSKPDGLVIVRAGDEAAFMTRLRLKDVWGIGEKTRARLEESGLATVEQILACSESLLQGILGPGGGTFLHTVIRGIDPGLFVGESATRSLSSERTFAEDVIDADALETTLLELSSEVMYRMLDAGLSGRTVHLKIRYSDFRTVSIQETFDRSVRDTGDLFARAKGLLARKLERTVPVRLLGVGIFNVTDEPLPEQGDLFESRDTGRQRKVEEALLALSRKRGKKLVTRARLIDSAEGPDE
jgi:DNA polymerase IV